MKTFDFPQGSMPAIGLGTWKMEDGAATAAVKSAIESGYRHLDCAAIYMNQKDVGVGLDESFSGGAVDRADVWVTSKLWCNRHRPDLVESALRETLADLRLDYLDLYMIHWPVAFREDVHRPESGADFISLDEMPLVDTWKALEACVDAGLCKNIGVCNFSIKKLQTILDDCRIKPTANQVESHPYLPQNDLFEFCRANSIQPVGYSPLGSGDRPERLVVENDPNLFDETIFKDIASEHQLTPAQVILSWAVNRSVAVIPKSANPGRQAENLVAASVELTAEEMSAIDSIATKHRYFHGRFWAIEGSPYTVESLWDEPVS